MKINPILQAICAAAICALALSGAQAAAPLVDIKLKPIGTFAAGMFDAGASEIVAHDPTLQRIYSVNALDVSMDVLDIQNPKNPTLVAHVDLLPYGGAATSVAVRNSIIAVAVPSGVATDPGKVVFFNSALAPLSAVTVGVLPDTVTFAPNGTLVLAANEAQPSEDYTIDPEGSVSIIDISAGAATPTVSTVGFTSFNGATLDPSIRIFGVNTSGVPSTVAQDLEPEYIAVSADSTKAWVTLQENNALAIIDIPSKTVTSLVGLGFKDHSLVDNALDASDRDDAINIATWPILGMYQPDAIHAFVSGGETYLLLANEGDSRAYEGFNEEARVGGLALDSTAFPNAADLKKSAALGRLRVTNATGDTDDDGDFDAIYAFGARSFSIRSATGALVFDSGDQLEQITAAFFPRNFNASNANNDFDNRSDDKGPEPESITSGVVFGRRFAFIALERIGGIVAYDITDPANPVFAEYANNRHFNFDVEDARSGDLGPEGIIFIAPENSPNGQALLAVGNEVSGTVTIFEIRQRD